MVAPPLTYVLLWVLVLLALWLSKGTPSTVHTGQPAGKKSKKKRGGRRGKGRRKA